MLQVALVDLRRGPKTFGLKNTLYVGTLRPWQLLIPPGVAHGYKVIGEQVIEPPHEANETYPLRASSPYSASRAGSHLLALSYFTTYKLNVPVTRASNNYGPYQLPEKLIPRS